MLILGKTMLTIAFFSTNGVQMYLLFLKKYKKILIYYVLKQFQHNFDNLVVSKNVNEVLSHRTSLIRHVRNLLQKFRQFLRNSLTNFLCRNVNNTKGPSLRIPSQTFVKKLHRISKDMDDDLTRNFLSNYTRIVIAGIRSKIVYINYKKNSIIIA